MKITYELSLENFEAWSGAVDTLNRIRNAGKCDELEAILEDAYPDGMTETELNDLLWFEPETVFEWLGMRTEDQIGEEIEEAEAELEEIKENYMEACREYIEEINEQRKEDNLPELSAEEIESIEAEIWKNDYSVDAEEIEEKIEELREELSEI